MLLIKGKCPADHLKWKENCKKEDYFTDYFTRKLQKGSSKAFKRKTYFF